MAIGHHYHVNTEGILVSTEAQLGSQSGQPGHFVSFSGFSQSSLRTIPVSQNAWRHHQGNFTIASS